MAMKVSEFLDWVELVAKDSSVDPEHDLIAIDDDAMNVVLLQGDWKNEDPNFRASCEVGAVPCDDCLDGIRILDMGGETYEVTTCGRCQQYDSNQQAVDALCSRLTNLIKGE